MPGYWKDRSDHGKRLTGRRGVEQRKRRLARTNGLCEHCLAKTPRRVSIATVVNHKIPFAHGGTDDDENTENLCDPCDEIVTAKQFGFKAPRQQIGSDGWPTTS